MQLIKCGSIHVLETHASPLNTKIAEQITLMLQVEERKYDVITICEWIKLGLSYNTNPYGNFSVKL